MFFFFDVPFIDLIAPFLLNPNTFRSKNVQDTAYGDIYRSFERQKMSMILRFMTQFHSNGINYKLDETINENSQLLKLN